jgi:hypothetical protein
VHESKWHPAHIVVLNLDRLVLIEHKYKLGLLVASTTSTLHIANHSLQRIKANDQITCREIQTLFANAGQRSAYDRMSLPDPVYPARSDSRSTDQNIIFPVFKLLNGVLLLFEVLTLTFKAFAAPMAH